MRWFLGIPLPEEVRAVVDNLQSGWPHGRWPLNIKRNVEPHITVKAPFTSSDDLWLSNIAGVTYAPAPVIAVQGLDLFDGRVVHLAVSSPGLLQIRDIVVAGFPEKWLTRLEREGYNPHITVGLAKRRLAESARAEIKKQLGHKIPSFEAPCLRVYVKQGQTYEPHLDLKFSG
jgi:2'-5' RNA ligase